MPLYFSMQTNEEDDGGADLKRASLGSEEDDFLTFETVFCD